MFERQIYEAYGLFCEERFFVGDYEAFIANGKIYIFVPIKDGDFQECLQMASWLKSRGEQNIAERVDTVRNEPMAVIDGEEGMLFVCPERSWTKAASPGEELALFHERGRIFPNRRLRSFRRNYYLQWHKLWEKRLEQLERWHGRLMLQGAQTEIDELFLTTFPYYLSLSETAMQYFVNVLNNVLQSERDLPSICHERFTETTWPVLPKPFSFTILPTDFLIDHYSRDVAEYIRHEIVFKHSPFEKIASFLEQYSRVQPLSSFAWQMIFARLLFPLHYFTCAESFYKNEKLARYSELAKQFVRVLQTEQKNTELLKIVQQFVPYEKIDWLNI